MPRRLSLILLLALCGLGADPGTAREGAAKPQAAPDPGRVTLHVKGMTERLQLL
jgi:hypothetical protein